MNKASLTLETPHFPTNIFGPFFEASVYEPAEDTFLLLDAIEKDLTIIRNLNPLICMEIGCGSGTVITSLINALGHNNRLYLATDINPKALECTRKCTEFNLTANDVEVVQLVQTELSTCLRLDRSVDLLIFNPPYVPTPDEEIKNGIEATWAGGSTNGRVVIDRFISETVTNTLSDTGLAYMVTIAQNQPEIIEKKLAKLGFICSPVITRKCGIEKLTILRFQRINK